jgi:hypothetical protein
MAQAAINHSRFHNLSNEALADAIGNADLALKAHEAEVKALKDEFKSRGLLTTAGEHFTVTRSNQVSSRLDVAAVKEFLGDAWRRFETASITTVIRIKPPSGSPARRSAYASCDDEARLQGRAFYLRCRPQLKLDPLSTTQARWRCSAACIRPRQR